MYVKFTQPWQSNITANLGILISQFPGITTGIVTCRRNALGSSEVISRTGTQGNGSAVSSCFSPSCLGNIEYSFCHLKAALQVPAVVHFYSNAFESARHRRQREKD